MDKVLDQEKTPVFDGGEGLAGMTWNETCQMWKEKYPVVLPKHLVDDDTKEANVYALVHHLSTRLKENQITVVGNGSACVAGGHGYIIKKGQRFITNLQSHLWVTIFQQRSAPGRQVRTTDAVM